MNEDFEFVKRIRRKAEYDEVQVNEPLYYYNFDEERMLQRIEYVIRKSSERREQGLPPLYVDDEFSVGEIPAEIRGGNILGSK